MSEKIDQWALDLLEKTRESKLDWRIMANPQGRDWFVVDIANDHQFEFHLWSVDSGENREITLRLQKGGRTVFESVANNLPAISELEAFREKVKKFRALSDLFDAVREYVYGKEETAGEVEELLRKIG
jgi:hypothetical protein